MAEFKCPNFILPQQIKHYSHLRQLAERVAQIVSYVVGGNYIRT